MSTRQKDSNDRIIYSLNVEDVQTVAEQELGREVSTEEIETVEREIGDYIKWYDMIHITMINANIE